MLYENYRENIVYSSQSRINFPRNGPNNRIGEGIALFLMCPNRNKAVETLQDPILNLVQSSCKRILTDSIYREKIGTSRIMSAERAQTDRYYMQIKDFPLYYIPNASRKSVLSKKKNVVNDLSRWMDIIFSRIDQLSAYKKCSEFIRILKDRLNDSLFNGYEKILLLDINSWTTSIKNCVIMNRALLNNPLSILLYTANYYPELLSKFPNVKLMIINRGAGQVYITSIRYLNRSNYPKIKSKLSLFKSLIFSVEDSYDPTDDNVELEMKTQMLNEYKEALRKKLKYNLLGNDPESDPFSDIDITSDTAEPMDENLTELENEINSTKNNIKEEDSEVTSTEVITDEITDIESDTDFSLNEEISKAIDEEMEEIDDLSDLEEKDIDKVAFDIAERIKDRKYSASFLPKRTEEELNRIKRLTQKQDEVIPPTKEMVEQKKLDTSITGGYIDCRNPNLISSKFVNFDKKYVEKVMNKDIDDAVSILSTASDKIFVIGKKITDSSTPQDLKETYRYKLEDEKGNKMTLSFDIPKIIDGNYVYLNGTKKNIRHQFILKPIVKTSPNAVQLVTFYNKVFIYRRGIVNQNVNRIVTYLEKNLDKYKVNIGNSSMKNDNYEVPLDYAMFSRYFSEFTINGYIFYTSIDSLLKHYKKLMKEDLDFDKSLKLPIALNPRTKDVIFLDLTNDSYTDIVLSKFNEDELQAIRKIKRKPKLVMASAKMMKRELPLILFMLYCEGFASVMKKANIEYEFVDKNSKKKYDPMQWDSIELSDGFIVWKKSPFRNELLMNGLKVEDMTRFSYDELESKDTYISLILPKYPGNNKIYFALDNYRDFLLDAKTKDILMDLGYPTDLVSLLVVAAGMLTDTHYIIENNMNNMRIRSNEVVSELVYSAVTRAYTAYRETSYKKKPTSLKIKKSQIIDDLLSSDTNMIEEYSSLNPILELEKQRAVTFKGIRGIQLDRAMTLPRRAYDKSMLGTVGISSSPDANIGVVRQLTMEPQITSTNGYIDASKSEDDLNSANLFTVAEMISPLGVTHDDPDRTAMEIL